jgi:nitroreductase
MNYDELLKLVQSRRSTRRFKPDPVPDEYIDKIIEVARWAPSGFNLQPWEFFVVKDPQLKDSIIQFCRESMENTGKMEATREPWQSVTKPPPQPAGAPGGDYRVAPVFILLFGDTRTSIGLPMYRRYSAALTQEAFKGGLASAFLYMNLAATSLGLGSQWVSSVTTPYAHCMIKNLLGIPEGLEIYDMMVLGYPAVPHVPRPLREKSEMVHYDRGGDTVRTDEQVKDFIRKVRGG